MSSLSILCFLALAGGPSPTEVLEDLNSRPWRPAPAAPVAAESSARPVPAGIPTPPPKVPGKEMPTANGTWQLQLGALTSSEAAGAEKKRLEKILGTGTVEIFADAGVNKLRYGRFSTKEEAETARAALKGKGVDGFAALRP